MASAKKALGGHKHHNDAKVGESMSDEASGYAGNMCMQYAIRCNTIRAGVSVACVGIRRCNRMKVLMGGESADYVRHHVVRVW